MPNDFWRRSSYDDYRKRQAERDASKPVTPLLPPLTTNTPKSSNTLPSWLSGSSTVQPDGNAQAQEPESIIPTWVGGREPGMPQSESETPQIPKWFRSIEPFGGEAQPAKPKTLEQTVQSRPAPFAATRDMLDRIIVPYATPQQSEQQPIQPPWLSNAPGMVIPQNYGRDVMSSPTNNLWPGAQPNVNQRPLVVPQQSPTELSTLTLKRGVGKGTDYEPTYDINSPIAGHVREYSDEQIRQLDPQNADALIALKNELGGQYNVLDTITALGDAAQDTIYSIIDRTAAYKKEWGQLSPAEVEAVKSAYAQTDTRLSPEMRLNVALQKLPESSRNKVLNASDWTRANFAAPATGRLTALFKGYSPFGAPPEQQIDMTDDDGSTKRWSQVWQDNQNAWRDYEEKNTPPVFRFIGEMALDPTNYIEMGLRVFAPGSTALKIASAVNDIQSIGIFASGDTSQKLTMAAYMAGMRIGLPLLIKGIKSANIRNKFSSDEAAAKYLSDNLYDATVSSKAAGEFRNAADNWAAALRRMIADETDPVKKSQLTRELNAISRRLNELDNTPYKTPPEVIDEAKRASMSLKDRMYQDFKTMMSIPWGDTRRSFRDYMRDIYLGKNPQWENPSVLTPEQSAAGAKWMSPIASDAAYFNFAEPGNLAYGKLPQNTLPKLIEAPVQPRVSQLPAMESVAPIPLTGQPAASDITAGISEPALTPRILGQEQAKPSIVEEMNAAAPGRVAGYREREPTRAQAASPLDSLIDSQTGKLASSGKGLQYESRAQARQVVAQNVIDDITGNWETLDEAQAWLDSNDASNEVHLHDDTYVSREAVQEAIDRKRGTTAAAPASEAMPQTRAVEQPAPVDYNIRNIRNAVASDVRASKFLPSSVIDAYETNPSSANAAQVATGLWKAINSPNTAPEVKSRLTNYLESLNAKHGLEVMGHNGQRVPSTGFVTVKILASEPREGLTSDTVIQTVKPSIYQGGKLVQSGEVIVGFPPEQTAKASAETPAETAPRVKGESKPTGGQEVTRAKTTPNATYIAERYPNGLYEKTMGDFGKQPLSDTLNYSWRSMGEKEYQRIAGGQSFGGGEAKRGGFWANNPARSASIEGNTKIPHYLVEVKVPSEGEALTRAATIDDITGVWRSVGKGWEKVELPQRVPTSLNETPRVAAPSPVKQPKLVEETKVEQPVVEQPVPAATKVETAGKEAGVAETPVTTEVAPTTIPTFTRPDGTTIERTVGKPVVARRTASLAGEQSGKTLTIPAHFAIGELDDVQPSHFLTGVRNPEYPAERQPRDYNTASAKATVEGGIENPDYRAMVMPSETVDEGPALVTPDGFIVNGTNRRLIAEGISKDPTKWANYQVELHKALPELGIDEAELSKYKQPYLYRVTDEGVPQADILEAAKAVSTTKELSTAEAAKEFAKVVNSDRLAGITPGETPRATLDDPRNSFFVQGYITSQPPNHRTSLMNADGKLTEDGVNEIRNATFVAVYGNKGEKMLNKFTSSGEAKMIGDALFNSLFDMAKAESLIKRGERPADLSLSDDFIAAIDRLMDMRGQKMKLGDYLAQIPLKGFETRPEMTVTQRQLLSLFDQIVSGNRAALRKVMKTYADKVAGEVPQMNMFSSEPTTKSRQQLFTESLIENGIDAADFVFGPRVQEAPPADTPADSPTVDYDKPTALPTKNADGTNNIEWGQTVNRDGKAIMKEKPVFSTSDRDWLSYNDRAKRAIVKDAVNNSAWGLRSDKAQIIDDIIKATDEWANKLQEIRTSAEQGELPAELVRATGEPATPAGGEGGANNPPPRTPTTGEAEPVGQPQPGGSIGNQLPGMPGVAPSQARPRASSRRARSSQANRQAQMTTAGGSPPPSNSPRLFEPQTKWQDEVKYAEEHLPWVIKKIKNPRLSRAIVVPTRGIFPQVGAHEADSLNGMVWGRIIHQGDNIEGTAATYLNVAKKKLEETGLKLVKRKVNGKEVEFVDGMQLKPESEMPLFKGQPVPDEFKRMSNNSLDLFSLPNYFKPITTDPVKAAQQTAAIMDFIHLTEQMFTEIRTDAESRGVKLGSNRTNTEYYIPRDVRDINDIEPRNRSVHDKGRTYLTATEGMNNPDEQTEYYSVMASIPTYISAISHRIANQESWNVLHNLLGARTVDDLIKPDYRFALKMQKGYLDNVNVIEDIITDLSGRVDNNFGAAPMTIDPRITWLDGEMGTPGELVRKMTALAREADPATKMNLKNQLMGEVHKYYKKYTKGVADAEAALQHERDTIVKQRRADAQLMGVGAAGEEVAVDPLSNVPGASDLYMVSSKAQQVNDWFGTQKENAVLSVINDLNTVSKLLTQSSDAEMVGRMAALLLKSPRRYIQSVISMFASPEKMDAWMARPDIAELRKIGQRWGLNLDTSSEVIDSYSEAHQAGVFGEVLETRVGKFMVGLQSNAANTAQLLYLQREIPRIKKLGERRARKLGDTSPEAVQRAIDYEGRGFVKSFHDHFGLRSMLGSGDSKKFRTWSRLLFMSGRKTSGWVNVPFNIFKQGAEGKYARELVLSEAFINICAATALMATAGLLTSSNILEADYWDEFTDPESPYFLTITVGGRRISPGGPVLRDVRQIAYIIKTLEERPDELNKIGINNPLFQYWVSRGAPVPNLIRDVVTGKDYSGNRITGWEWAREGLRMVAPMTVQDFIQKNVLDDSAAAKVVGDARKRTMGDISSVVAQWVGWRSSPESPAMLLTKMRDYAALKEYDTKWANLDMVDKWTLTEAYPEIDQLEELAILASSEKDDPTALFEVDLQEEYDKLAASAEIYRMQYKSGKHPDGTAYTGQDYRNDMRSLDAKRAELPAIIKGANPAYKNIPVTQSEKDAYYAKYQKTPTPVDSFIDAWYQCSQDAITDETTGQIDFDKLFSARDALVAKTSPLIVAKAMPYINRNKDEDLQYASQLYQEYMDLPKYDGLDEKEAGLLDEFKREWTTLRMSGVPDAKLQAGRKFPKGYNYYVATGGKTSTARRRYMYANGVDSSMGYTKAGYWINLFYGDLTLPDLLEAQPELASSFAE